MALGSGDPIEVNLAYDGSTLTEQLTDLSTGATWSTSYTSVDLAAITGGSTAYLGFTGGTGGLTSTQTISDFTFASSVGGLLPAATTVEIAAGAMLNLNGANQTLAGLADGVPGAGGEVHLGSATLTVDATASSTFSGAISGPGGLTKTGSAAVTLDGASSYTGSTLVSAGTVALGPGGSLGNTAMTVSAGAVFAPNPQGGSVTAGATGSGSAGATLNLASGATFDMTGGGIGAFDLQGQTSFAGPALTLSGATLDFDLTASGPGQLIVGQGVSLSGTNTVNLSLPSSSGAGGEGVRQPSLGQLQLGFRTSGRLQRQRHARVRQRRDDRVRHRRRQFLRVGLGQQRHGRDALGHARPRVGGRQLG